MDNPFDILIDEVPQSEKIFMEKFADVLREVMSMKLFTEERAMYVAKAVNKGAPMLQPRIENAKKVFKDVSWEMTTRYYDQLVLAC